jgi:hypothetical protein
MRVIDLREEISKSKENKTMTTNAAGRYFVVAFGFILIAGLTAAEPVKAEEPSAGTQMLDAMPPELFQKMFRDQTLVGSPGLAWKRKRVLTVAFDGGSDDLYELIERTANDWTAAGGQLSLSFKDDAGQYRHWTTTDSVPAADIRISFDRKGYWSMLGVLATKVEPGDPTMNYQGFPEKLKKYFGGANAAEWRKSYEHTAILHEFGHAFGLSHEHFNPECQKDLLLETIIAYLMGPPNNWTREVALFNIDAQYYAKMLAQQAGPLESKIINKSYTDQSSVMLYTFPPEFFASGDRSVCKPAGDRDRRWATTLSEDDELFYVSNYRVVSAP